MKQKDLSFALIILTIGSLLTLLAPYLLTRHGFIDFNQTGPIGDTIGGITAPITNLLGAVLVFYALKAQIESNEMTRTQFKQQEIDELNRREFSYLAEQVDIIRSEINEFGFVHQETDSNKVTITTTYKGASAFDKLIDVAPDIISYIRSKDGDPFVGFTPLANTKMLLVVIDKTIDKINTSKITSNDKQQLISMLSYQYLSKIKAAFNAKYQQYRMMPLVFDIGTGHKESVFTDEIQTLLDNIDNKINVIQ